MRKIAELLVRHGAVIRRSVTLTSGRASNLYIDVKILYGNPKALTELAGALSKIIPRSTTCIATGGYGGIPLGVAVSAKLKLPLALVREKRKTYGTKKIIDGHIPKTGDKVAIIDDVCTSGGSIRVISRAVKKSGARIGCVCVVVNRSETSLKLGTTVHALTTVKEIIGVDRMTFKRV